MFKRRNSEIIIVYLILAIIIVFGAIATHGLTLSVKNIGNLIEQSTALGLVSIAQMIVLLIGGIDLSIGALVSSVVCILSYGPVDSPLGFIPFVLIGLAAAILVGLFNGFGYVKIGLPPFIMTLATSCILQGVALMIRPTPGGSMNKGLKFLLNGDFGFISHGAVLWIALIILFGWILKRKRFGRNLYAVGGSETTAQLSGINVKKVKILAFLLTSFLGFVAALFVAARVATGDPSVGNSYSMDSVTVCVLAGISLSGGRGGIGAMIGSTFIMCSLSNMLNMMGVTSFAQYAFKGIILLVAVLIMSFKDLRVTKE